MDYDDGDEEEQRPLTTADIRALLDELLEEQDAKHKKEIRSHKEEIRSHKEEIRLQVDEQDARHKEQIRLQEERINAAHKEEIRALEEATDRRFKDLEEALASSSPPQDTANNTAGVTQTNDENLPLTDNQGTSNTQLNPNRPRRRTSAIFSFLFFRRGRNEDSGSDHDDEAGDDNDSSEVLEKDTFSLMMLNKPFRKISFCHPALVKIIPVVGLLGFILLFIGVIYVENVTLHWFLLATFAVIMFGPLSCPWILSMFTFLWLQLALGLSIIGDQAVLQLRDLDCYYSGTCTPFDIPLRTNTGLTMARYLVVFFAITTQNDIFSSLQTLGKLRNADNIPWDRVIGQPGNRTWGLWICRILLPNIFKFIQAAVILFTTFILIIQTRSIVDLLKDFTSLLVVSEADNIIFHIASLGYFGENLKKKTEEVKAVRWMIANDTREEGDTDENEQDKPRCWRSCCNMSSCFFLTLFMVMIGGLTYVVVGQFNGRYMRMKYPECDVTSSFIDDGWCLDWPPYNTAECGWDGGDCPEPSIVKGYINCAVSFPDKIGDGRCYNEAPYNTAECGWDGGDCLEP